jgi:hypothetical protein
MENQTEQIENGLFVTDYNELVNNSWKILKGEYNEKSEYNI